MQATSEQALVVAKVQHWRRSVVRGWIATMIAAVATWGAAAAWPSTPAVASAGGLTLLTLLGYACWNMRRGRCPQCHAAIRFEPRIELPRNCRNCGVPFNEELGKSDDEIRN